MDMESRILQLELDSEHAKREIIELRDIVIALSFTINDIDEKITKFLEDGKSER
jgi:hypothetical protein